MDKKAEFVSQITSFPPLSPETNDSGVTVLLNKFFKFARNSPAEGADNNNTGTCTPTDTASRDVSWKDVAPEEAKDPPDRAEQSQYPEELGEGRSLQNVLRRISSLVALKSSGVAYADTEHARYWMPDHVSRECFECGAKFSAFRRRHHCRVCGQIFCARCCSHRVPGHVCGCAGGLRVCTHCCRIVLGYLQTAEGGDMLTEDLKALQDNLKEKGQKEAERPVESGFLQEVANGGDGADGRTLGGHPPSLHEIFHQLCRSLPLQHQRYRLIRYPAVWRGGDISQWLLERHTVATSTEAATLCQSFLNEGLLECVTEQATFTDYALYKPINSTPLSSCDPSAPASMSGSTSSYCLDLNLADNSARVVRGQRKDMSDNVSNTEPENSILLEADDTEGHRACCPAVEAAGAEHLRLLLVQGLARAGLSLAWTSVLLPLCQQAANMVSLDVNSSEWDIRRCVRVKRVAGGSVKECRTVPGVVFSKNLAHRAMATRINSPSILLLKCSIGYQRVEGKLVSLEPVIMQEQEYLRQCCARILSYEPDLLLVAGGVSRLAQEQLRARGLALALGVRQSVLRRVARACRGDILASVDAHVARTPPRLGSCKGFYLLNYESKTLMVLEGYPNDLKCCSIILRGSSLEELGKIKRVISLVLLAAYNWRLESSLLGDMGATLPVSSTSLMFTDNSKDNTPDRAEDGESAHEKLFQDFGDNQSMNQLEINMNSATLKKDETEDVATDNSVEEKSDCVDVSSADAAQQTTTAKEHKLTPAPTDPLTSDAFMHPSSGSHRRMESDKTKSCGIAVDDFSDPLRAQQLSIDDDVFLDTQEKQCHEYNEETGTLRERWSAEECVISVSPQVRVVVPYLESEAGRRCTLRPYYRAPLFPPQPPRTPPHRKVSLHQASHLELKEAHPFASLALKQSAEEPDVRALLANFRANGGRLTFESFKVKTPPVPKAEVEDPAPLMISAGTGDPLDPEQHQRLYLLYYSYCSRSHNAPDFCVNPWIVRMNMYGVNDIPLGLFLERHCFNHQTACTSRSCQVPLSQHVRKFVHGDGCITVTCNSVESSTTRGVQQHKLTNDEEGKQAVMWWCRCTWCRTAGAGGGGACMRPSSLALSLAKYLELRFHAPRYTRARACHHSLNQHHAHFFAQNNTTACFRYSKIKWWDISLPPPHIATHHNTRALREGLINQVNDLVLKGHEVFSSLGETEVEKEHATFKQHVEQIQLNLTSSSLQEQPSGAGVVRWLWTISDALVVGEKLLGDALEKWTTQTPSKVPFKMAQDIVDGKIESDDSSQPDFNAVDCLAENKGISGNSCEVEHTGEEEEDKSDKKGLRAMLSQLLNSSQPAHQNGVVLCGGVIPLIVRASEISSLAAAALASQHYQFTLQTAPNCSALEQDDKENGAGGAKEKTDADGKSKNAKNTEHIDVQLHDGLSCRVFYAKQFMKLRAMLLCPLESNSHIVNDFSLKAHESDTESSNFKEDKRSEVSTNQCDHVKESECEAVSQVLSSIAERDIATSVESSPILGIKRSTEEKTKRFAKEAPVKLEPLTDIEEGFIRSLSRCVPWAARGGKSGSTFCKTIDDRFILKEMSKLEQNLFLSLAPHYFNHIHSCHQNKLPTLLGRIVGVYCVEGVGGVGGGVLVMENLWHGRGELAQRFDLKGAQRNRLAHQGPPDSVLLDENLLNLRWECPLYIQSHSAGVLWAAVKRDTEFLAAHHIMDYSLLVGLDQDRQELVLGIIDYIRTFTWDKKLEHIVKKGLGSGLPTIASPEQYKARFCTAMKKYFLQCPDQWEDLHRGLVSDQS